MKLASIRILPLAAAALCAAAGLAAHAQTLKKCVDDKGITYYGDPLPAACDKRAITEMTNQGTVVRKLDAPLTADQIKARDDDAARRKVEDAKINEQKLKDRALLATYGTEREFDYSRDKSLALVEDRRAQLVTRVQEVDKTIARLDNEIGFYQSGKSKNAKVKDPPVQLTMDIARAKADRANLDTEMARLEEERKGIAARYDIEKSRWKRLKAGMAPGTLLDSAGNVTMQPALPERLVGLASGDQPRGYFMCNGRAIECEVGKVYYCVAPKADGLGHELRKSIKCEKDTR